jgi:hypothetical protein
VAAAILALGVLTALIPASALPASAATAAPPAAAHAAQSPSDGPSGGGDRVPSAPLPDSATGRDGFVVLGLAIGALLLVALVTAGVNRPWRRGRSETQPAVMSRARRRPGTPGGRPISARPRYSSRSHRW